MSRVIALTSSSCNINCDYCYVAASRQSIDRVPIEALPTLIRNCSVGFDQVEFCWHGGEPLLAGKEFYRTAVSIQKKESEKRPITFQNGLQTNGILLDNEWLTFFKANDFGIGISFDAPPETHNLHRDHTAEKALNVFSMMRRLAFPCGAICVVSKHNVGKAREIFDFFRDQDISSYSFLPVKNVPRPNLPGPPTEEELAALYCETFDLWLSQPNQFKKIDPLYSMMLGLLGKMPPSCSFSAPCPDTMISVDQKGNVVPCRSLVAPPFFLGNVFNETLSEVLERSAQGLREVRARAIRQHCVACEFVGLCRGGCRADAYWATGHPDGAYPHCEARKITFRYLKKKLQEMHICN